MIQFKLKNILSISIFIALFLVAGPATAQCSFDEWDDNDNDQIENEEFDQVLNDNDYYSDWDSNQDGILTEEEWDAGTESWGNYKDNVDIGFFDWDLNYDNEITEDEFNDGLFETLDEDGSDTIDQNEWDAFVSEEDGLFC